MKAEGLVKWGALTGCVIALECVGKEPLTYYAHRAMEHRIGRWVVPAIVGITAMHLMDRDHDILPESIDAFCLIAQTVGKLANNGEQSYDRL